MAEYKPRFDWLVQLYGNMGLSRVGGPDRIKEGTKVDLLRKELLGSVLTLY